MDVKVLGFSPADLNQLQIKESIAPDTAPATASHLVERVEFYRFDATRRLDPKTRGAMGQFMTPAPVARFMASLFKELDGGVVRVLDPGAGVGTLTAAFVDEFCNRERRPERIFTTAYEFEPLLVEYLDSAFAACRQTCERVGIAFEGTVLQEDFIRAGCEMLQEGLFADARKLRSFTHCIMNPPYKKIHSDSEHRLLLRSIGVETSNLYTGFLTIAIKLLEPGGEIVAIVPRSFCNGPYFKPFRDLLLDNIALRRLHVFEARDQAFKDDEVLQENIIFYGVKGGRPGRILISATVAHDFDSMTIREVDYAQIVKPNDPERFIHIATNELDQYVVDRMSVLNHTLEELGLDVSTGPVVDFRLKQHLRDLPGPRTVPLIYPAHFKDGFIAWPNPDTRKPNAIIEDEESAKWLVPNGYYTVVRRFSAKEEKRRIVAAVHDPERVKADKIGLENHLNFFHAKGQGLPPALAKGLAVYLNSTLVDVYFRHFNGHTQVNATDLRTIHYPNREVLDAWGASVGDDRLPSQDQIDELLERTLEKMAKLKKKRDPVRAKKKIDEALEVLKALGLPRAQQNDRSALTLLAILDLKPAMPWSKARAPRVGITPIMYFCRDEYGKTYAPNTRETIRRQTMHQFVQAGIALSNPDRPDRPINSPDWCYQVTPDMLAVLRTYGTRAWKAKLAGYLKHHETLAQRYARQRDMQMIPVSTVDGEEIRLTPGKHSELIKAILRDFGPRYVPGGKVIYVGDTGAKWAYFDGKMLRELGVDVDPHGKMPDVVIYYPDKNWLLLIESVTSHGPVDAKRHHELAELFKHSKAGLVYVTAFPSRAEMTKHLGKISWETEVWVAEAPTHLIHFNGERFLGPHDK